jgi:hypothetical protein
MPGTNRDLLHAEGICGIDLRSSGYLAEIVSYLRGDAVGLERTHGHDLEIW